MPRIELHPKDEKMLIKIENIAKETNIIQRQLELTFGHWDFVVFGPNEKKMVIREGNAHQMRILNEPTYTLSVTDPSNYSGKAYGNIIPIPLEEFIAGDIPDELKGLDVLNIDPLRPLSINLEKTVPLSKGERLVKDEYTDKNIAIIQTPDEQYWPISVLKYLNECDQFFPSLLNEAIKKGNLPINARLLSNPQTKGFYLN
ncbi:hypothetical protein ACFL0M_14950 [Thermodesulfobacteriota bacterium]